MITGFEKIIEERILAAQRKGEFENLPGSGQPIIYENDSHIPEDLRLAYKMLKNADCVPPELEIKKEIRQTEELLMNMEDTAEKYHVIKKLNFLIMKLNTMRGKSIMFEAPQKYMQKLTGRIESTRSKSKKDDSNEKI